MIVYRVEHESIKGEGGQYKCGPFQDSPLWSTLSGHKMDVYNRAIKKLMDRMSSGGMGRFPTPVMDPHLGWIDPTQICGVDSIESVHEWFGPSLPLLEQVGFHVAKYEVPDWAVKCGWNGQVVFQYKYAKEITDDRADA